MGMKLIELYMTVEELALIASALRFASEESVRNPDEHLTWELIDRFECLIRENR